MAEQHGTGSTANQERRKTSPSLKYRSSRNFSLSPAKKRAEEKSILLNQAEAESFLVTGGTNTGTASSGQNSTSPRLATSNMVQDTPKTQEDDDEEDEVVRQAREIALNASKLLSSGKGNSVKKAHAILGKAPKSPDRSDSTTHGGRNEEDKYNAIPLVERIGKAKEKFEAFTGQLLPGLSVAEGDATAGNATATTTAETRKDNRSIEAAPIDASRSASNSPAKLRLNLPFTSANPIEAELQSNPNSTVMSITNLKLPFTSSVTSTAKQQFAEILNIPPTLSSTIWKRRSGYGKFSMRNSWEQRRLELRGTKIVYFTALESSSSPAASSSSIPPPPSELPPPVPGVESANSVDALDGIAVVSRSSDDGDAANIPQPPPPPNAEIDYGSNTDSLTEESKTKKDLRQLWEQASERITQNFNPIISSTTNDANVSSPSANSDGGGEQPRGMLDLLQDSTTIAAQSDNASGKPNDNHLVGVHHFMSSSPTPFGIGIYVKSEIKWKICFDTQKEQMQWLAALTSVVVKRSVESYNEGLIHLRKKEKEGGGDGGGVADLLQLPPGGKDGFWKMDGKFSFEDLGEEKSDDSQEIKERGRLENQNTLDHGDEPVEKDQEESENEGIVSDDMNPVETKSTIISENVVETSSFGENDTNYEIWSLQGKNIHIASIVFNASIFIVRISSTSPQLFWFVFVLMNTIGFMLLDKNGGNDDDKNTEKSNVSLNENHDTKETKKNGKRSLPLSPLRHPEEGKKKPRTPSNGGNDLSVPAPDVRNEAPSNTFTPAAGSSSKQVSNAHDPAMVNGHRFIKWMTLGNEEVQVRSHGYLKTKAKISAPSCLYEIVAVDALLSDMKITEMAKQVKLPTVSFKDDTNPKTWHSPDIFLITVSIPTEYPTFGRQTEDGDGFNIIIYYKMREETRQILRRVTAPGYNPASDSSEENQDVQSRVTNSVRLWEAWCRKSPNDAKFQGRFKLIINVHNAEDLGLPSYISKYCGKPVLIKRSGVTGLLSSHPNVNAMEMGVNLHPFPYIAKKAIAYLKDNIFDKALVSFSFVIEGREDDELPEALIGEALQLCFPDPKIGIKADDYFGGRAPSSMQEEEEVKEEKKFDEKVELNDRVEEELMDEVIQEII